MFLLLLSKIMSTLLFSKTYYRHTLTHSTYNFLHNLKCMVTSQICNYCSFCLSLIIALFTIHALNARQNDKRNQINLKSTFLWELTVSYFITLNYFKKYEFKVSMHDKITLSLLNNYLHYYNVNFYDNWKAIAFEATVTID